MTLWNNPVLLRELVANLRTVRALVLLALYQAILAGVVYVAWPQDTHLDLTADSPSIQQTRRLVNLFFGGQFLLASLMVPTFAAGSITGEKERKTYEMLLASPLTPAAIVLGKLLASLCHLGALIVASLPIVMLCLPLGGVSLYEVLAAYGALALSVATFGMISVAASAYFQRTSAALVVSYLLILPLAIVGVLVWLWLAEQGMLRLMLMAIVLPALALPLSGLLFRRTCRLLLYPPDVGSEGKEVVDLEEEARQAVGLVIQRDQFPDRLFAPPKRDDLIGDGENPVYDKEVRSEIFSQGTLMLRVVIQVSMLMALPLMAGCLFIQPQLSGWYVAYVLLFNMLVGPVFSAGSVTSERERETLELLLTTNLSPWQILWGKLLAGLRVSCVLTLFLLWPLALACVLVPPYWTNLAAVAMYLAVVLMTSLTTAQTALFCSVLFRKTAHALIVSYLAIATMFLAPLAVRFFAETFVLPSLEESLAVDLLQVASPFAAVLDTPLTMTSSEEAQGLGATPREVSSGRWQTPLWFLLGSGGLNLALLSTMLWLFRVRWRVAG
jgi:ABC-type transport system involved in multi-copper enzyme maturation permease subunit